MNSAVEIMDTGFACLVEKLGIVDAERFVAMIKRDSFDYTIWRREYFDKMNIEQISAEAAAYVQSHPQIVFLILWNIMMLKVEAKEVWMYQGKKIFIP